MRRSACRGPAITAPTSAISTCTRPSAFRMAAAARAWARSASRRIWRRSCPAIRSPTAARRTGRAGLGGAVRLGVDPDHLLHLHPDDGRRRPDARHRGRDPQRQLHRQRGSIRISRCCTATHKGRVAHECIIDPRALKATSGVTVDDIAKRLIDYGFHAPTMSFPVAGTLMIEPTESESKAELDRFCDAMIAIRSEIAEIESGRWTGRGLAAAPRAAHRARHRRRRLEPRLQPRARAASRPAPRATDKYWCPVGRVDNVYGDRNLVCSCPPVEDYAQAAE